MTEMDAPIKSLEGELELDKTKKTKLAEIAGQRQKLLEENYALTLMGHGRNSPTRRKAKRAATSGWSESRMFRIVRRGEDLRELYEPRSRPTRAWERRS